MTSRSVPRLRARGRGAVAMEADAHLEQGAASRAGPGLNRAQPRDTSLHSSVSTPVLTPVTGKHTQVNRDFSQTAAVPGHTPMDKPQAAPGSASTRMSTRWQSHHLHPTTIWSLKAADSRQGSSRAVNLKPGCLSPCPSCLLIPPFISQCHLFPADARLFAWAGSLGRPSVPSLLFPAGAPRPG